MSSSVKSAADKYPLLEWPIPQVGTSPVTGVTGTLFWGGINRPDRNSRWVIGDSDWDDGPNFFPQQVQVQQFPYRGATVATLASTAIWMSAQILNANLFNYFLCQNGRVYQVSTSGTIINLLANGSFTESGVLNGTTSVTGLSSTANMFVGMQVTGTFIQANTTISIINSPTSITLSLAATGSGTETLTFSIPPFSTVGDIANWQGTQILLSDPVAGNVYAWNGTTLLIALSGQPAQWLTVYGDRVWLFNGITITWTQGGTYNSLAGDAGSAQITDAGAASPILGAIANLGVIVVFGASWIATISNLIVSGSPAVLTFQFVVLSSQVGIGSKFSIIPCGNSFYFANAYGIWDLQGSAPVKISVQMDGFFDGSLDFTKTSFSSAYVVIYRQPCLIWQVYYTGDQNVPAAYTLIGCTLTNNQPNQWFRVVQGTIALISSLPANAAVGLPSPFGCDGTNIFPLFADTATQYPANLNLKIWDFYSKGDYKTYDYVFFSILIKSAITLSVSIVNESGQMVDNVPRVYNIDPVQGLWINQFGVQGEWFNATNVLGTWAGTIGITQPLYAPVQFGLRGHMRGLGLNISTNSAGLIIQAITVGYRRTTASRGP